VTQTTLLLLLPLLAAAQDRTAPARTRTVPPIPGPYSAPFASTPLRVDASLDDPAWTLAPAVALIFPWESQTGAKQATRVRLAWDESFLYAAYDCDDSEVTVSHFQRDDPTYLDDAVELYVNPLPAQQQAYYGFEMNARGVMYDYFMVFPMLRPLKQYNLTGFQLAARPRPASAAAPGWTLELAIPWANFSDLAAVPPRPGDSWRIQLVRWDGAAPRRRLSIWSDSGLESAFPHHPVRFGELRFVK
jgi:hypothetical protein